MNTILPIDFMFILFNGHCLYSFFHRLDITAFLGVMSCRSVSFIITRHSDIYGCCSSCFYLRWIRLRYVEGQVPELRIIIVRDFIAHLHNLSKFPLELAVEREDMLSLFNCSSELLIILEAIVLRFMEGVYTAKTLAPSRSFTTTASSDVASRCCVRLLLLNSKIHAWDRCSSCSLHDSNILIKLVCVR